MGVEPSSDHWNPFSYEVCEALKMAKTITNETYENEENAAKLGKSSSSQMIAFDRMFGKFSTKQNHFKDKLLLLLLYYFLLPLFGVFVIPVVLSRKLYSRILLTDTPYYRLDKSDKEKLERRWYRQWVLLAAVCFGVVGLVMTPVVLGYLFMVPIYQLLRFNQMK